MVLYATKPFRTINSQAINYNKEIANISICGGIPHIRQPVALISTNNEVDLLIPLNGLMVDGTEAQIKNIKPDLAGPEDEVYIYNGIMEAINKMNDIPSGTWGTNGGYIKLQPETLNTYDYSFGIVSAGLLLVIVFAIALFSRTHSKAR